MEAGAEGLVMIEWSLSTMWWAWTGRRRSHHMRWKSAPRLIALALLALPSVALAQRASDGAAEGCPELAVSTANKHLDLSPLAGVGHAPGGMRCTTLARAQYDPRTVDVGTASGLRLGIGKGGQIYSIRLPGIAEDLIPSQRDWSFYVDEVFQTAATNLAMVRASPQGRAKTPAEKGNPSWHYHQAGTYQRGILQGRAPHYSPLLYNRVDETAGIYESLNLAQQAHVRNTEVAPDRFLVYTRLKHEGDDVFEVTQAWLNHSRLADTARGAPTTILDYFNFPWVILRHAAVPHVVANVAGETLDLSGRAWPPTAENTVLRAHWIGAFANAQEDAPGMMFTLAPDLRTRLRVGKTVMRVVTNVAERRQDFRYAREGYYVISAPRADITIDRGEAIVARFYLAFGKRADLVARAERLHKQSSVSKLVLPASTSPSDLVALCRDAAGRLDPCAAGREPVLVLTRKACTRCAPLYELADRTTKGLVYSTDPYLDERPAAHLVDARTTPTRILGWLMAKEANVPAGMAARALVANDPLAIRAHASDLGQFIYLVPARGSVAPTGGDDAPAKRQ